MTIEEMRVILDMPVGEYTDAQVVAAYAAYLNGDPDLPDELVTLETAKAHLRVIGDAHDGDIELKIRAASRIVIDHLDLDPFPWTEENLPESVRAAVLLVLGALFENREGGDPLGVAAVNLLTPHRRFPMA